MSNSMCGDEYNRRNENFKNGLIELDIKHIEYFKPRPPVLFSRQTDCIVNHFIMTNLETSPSLKITSEGIPKEIVDDLINLFHQHLD